MIQFAGLKKLIELIENGLTKNTDCSIIQAQMVLEYGDRVEDVRDSSKFFLVGLRILDALCVKDGVKKKSL